MDGKRNRASHGTNSQESLKFFNDIIIPYIESKRLSHDMAADQRALVIMDVFTGQMTSDVLNLLSENNILLTNVPPNMTKYYQPLDLTVNEFAKRYMSNKFNDWYTKKVSEELDKGVPIDEIDIKFRLSLLKPLHAEWITNFYNHMTSSTAKNVIESGWLSAGITDAIRLGLSQLPSIDPFDDLAPMVETNLVVADDFTAICSLTPETKTIGYSREEDSDDDDDYWQPADEENRNIFSVLDELDEEA